VEREKIIFLRSFFCRAFVIGLAFALFYFVLTVALWDTWKPLVLHLFKVDEKEIGRIAVLFFTEVRLVVVFLFLVPALALHWALKRRGRSS
jgi:hypothetical protein